MIEEKVNREIRMGNDALFKSLFRSVEAREVVATVLSCLTKLDKELFMKAHYVGGKIPKIRLKEKGKSSDIIVKIEDNLKVILEMNDSYYQGLFSKNSGYFYGEFLDSTKVGSKKSPKIIMVNIDNFNSFKTEEVVLDFRLRDKSGKYIENDSYLSIHLILENAAKESYNVDKELIKFAKFMSAKTLEELEEVSKGDEKYMVAYEKVAVLFGEEEDFVLAYDKEEMHQWEKEQILEDAKEIKEEAIEMKKEATEIKKQANKEIEQLHKEKAKIIQELESRKMSVKEISDIVGMSEIEIQKILKG